MMDYVTYMEAFKFMISRHKLFWKLKDQVYWIVSIRLPFSILTSAPCFWAVGHDLMDRIIHDLLLSNSEWDLAIARCCRRSACRRGSWCFFSPLSCFLLPSWPCPQTSVAAAPLEAPSYVSLPVGSSTSSYLLLPLQAQGQLRAPSLLIYGYHLFSFLFFFWLISSDIPTLMQIVTSLNTFRTLAECASLFLLE